MDICLEQNYKKCNFEVNFFKSWFLEVLTTIIRNNRSNLLGNKFLYKVKNKLQFNVVYFWEHLF